MTDFIVTQLFGLNGLVNLSNVVFLTAFSVRDVLHLRLLSVVAYVVILPYYFFQQETLWPPIFWGVAFIVVNGVRILVLLLERRPVVFNDEEENLYQLAFGSMDKRDFLKLLNANGVDYLLIGAYAVNYHGYIRSTDDIDVWIAIDPDNAQRVANALKTFGFDLPGVDAAMFMVPDKIVRMGVPPVRIEISTGVSGVDFQTCLIRIVISSHA